MADWRFRSRIVAYTDLAFTGFGFGWVCNIFYVGIIGTLVTSGKVQPYLKENSHKITGITILVWILLGFYLLACILQFYAAMKLKSATEEGRDPGMAREMARNWMIITIVFRD